MLKDRRILIEQELAKTQAEAAKLYLNIVVGHYDDVHSPEYQLLKNRIMNLQFDLNMINQLIDKGHE
jgi:hypothetical protein